MKVPSKHQKLILCYWTVIPALIPLFYIFIVHIFRLYEMIFFVDVRDIYAEYKGIQAQYGVKRALRHIHEYYPWYRYSMIVFIITYYFSEKLFLIKKNNYFGMYFSVLGIYIFSVYFSILIFFLTSMLLGRGDSLAWLLFIPGSAYYTLLSFVGGSEFYAPYALPSIMASIPVSIGIVMYKKNIALKADKYNAKKT